MRRFIAFFCLAFLTLAVNRAEAGGVDPRDMPPEQPVTRERVTAAPAETSAAVSEARRAVAPKVREEQLSGPEPQPVVPARGTDWMLRTSQGDCAPLATASLQVKNIGTFATPREFARQMQQRGYRPFVLDIGDTRDQVVRVKVPDQDVDLTFVRASLCR